MLIILKIGFHVTFPAVGNGGDETAAAAQESVAEERNLQGVLIEDKVRHLCFEHLIIYIFINELYVPQVVSLVEIARQPLPKCPLVSEVSWPNETDLANRYINCISNEYRDFGLILIQ